MTETCLKICPKNPQKIKNPQCRKIDKGEISLKYKEMNRNHTVENYAKSTSLLKTYK